MKFVVIVMVMLFFPSVASANERILKCFPPFGKDGIGFGRDFKESYYKVEKNFFGSLKIYFRYGTEWREFCNKPNSVSSPYENPLLPEKFIVHIPLNRVSGDNAWSCRFKNVVEREKKPNAIKEFLDNGNEGNKRDTVKEFFKDLDDKKTQMVQIEEVRTLTIDVDLLRTIYNFQENDGKPWEATCEIIGAD